MPEQDDEEAVHYLALAISAGRAFSPSAPVDAQALFAGRLDQLRMVIDALRLRGQHAIIFGERGVGKTSLANVFSNMADSDGRPVVAPRVNCDASDDFSSIWRKVFSDINVAREVPGVGFEASPTTVATDLSDQLPERITPEHVRRTLRTISEQAFTLIIIDEFDRLSSSSVGALFADTIKTLSDHSVDATIVLVGVADSVDDLIQEHQSVERALIQVPMPRMSLGELHEIIRKGLEQLQMSIEDDALQKIALLSQGLPHYTHLLGLHSVRRALDSQSMRITLEHVDLAIASALSQAQQSTRSAYHLATTSPRTESLYRQVLLACALSQTDELGYFSPADVREPMSTIMGRRYDIPSFVRHLTEFSDTGRGPILKKTGGERRIRYRFINPLMQPYITMRGVVDGLVDSGTLERLQSRL